MNKHILDSDAKKKWSNVIESIRGHVKSPIFTVNKEDLWEEVT